MYTVISEAARGKSAYPDPIVSFEDPISSGPTLFPNEDISGFSRTKIACHAKEGLGYLY